MNQLKFFLIFIVFIIGIFKVCSQPACSDNVSRFCNEALNALGPNLCATDNDCYNGRTCSNFGFCQGQGVVPACTDHVTIYCNEATNSYGPNQCQTDEDCFDGRTCSSSNFCQ